jgi:hypothetical protein
LNCFAPNLTPVCERCVRIHIILMFFIWSGNHKFYIQFLRLLGLQSFIITLYVQLILVMVFNIFLFHFLRFVKYFMCQQYTLLFQQYPMTICSISAKAHKTIFAPNNIYYFIFKPNKTIKRTPLERNFSDLNY